MHSHHIEEMQRHHIFTNNAESLYMLRAEEDLELCHMWLRVYKLNRDMEPGLRLAVYQLERDLEDYPQ